MSAHSPHSRRGHIAWAVFCALIVVFYAAVTAAGYASALTVVGLIVGLVGVGLNLAALRSRGDRR